MLHRLGRAVGIIIGDVIYLPAVDAAAVVDRLYISENSPADEPDRRGRPAERKNSPDLYLRWRYSRRSAANADDPSANSISAKAGLKNLSIASSPYEQRSARPRRGRDPANRGRCSAVFFAISVLF